VVTGGLDELLVPEVGVADPGEAGPQHGEREHGGDPQPERVAAAAFDPAALLAPLVLAQLPPARRSLLG
jgi:hypothetical protein